MARSSSHRHVLGVEQMTAALRGISDDMRSQVLVKGAKAAAQPVLVAMKRFAKRSEDTGALRASLTIKAVGYSRTGKAVALIGPDKGYYHGRKKASALGRALLATSRPAWYAHLVEYGHNVVAPKKGTTIRKGTATAPKSGKTWVQPKPFIRPAVLTTTVQQGAAFRAAVDKEFNRIVRKHTKG